MQGKATFVDYAKPFKFPHKSHAVHDTQTVTYTSVTYEPLTDSVFEF